VQRDSDATDTHIPNLIWWGFERQLRNDPAAVVALLCTPEARRGRLFQAVLERTARALSSNGTAQDFALCARLLDSPSSDRQSEPIVTGMDLGLEGRRLDKARPALHDPLARLWAASRTAPSDSLIRVCARTGRTEAIAAALKLASDRHEPENRRIAMIGLLGELGRADDASALLSFLDKDSSAALQLAAVAALGRYHDASLSAPMLSRARSAPPLVRSAILALLASRPAWAKALVDAIGRGEIAVREITPAHVQMIAKVAEPAVVKRLETLWGKLPAPGSPEKTRRIAEVRGLLPEGDKGNAARGKPIFKEHCAVCHKLFDEGENIGPELTGADRGNLDFLLTSLVDPSAQVRKEYQSQTIALRDGRVLSGLVVDENDRVLTLMDSNRQKTLVARELIEAVRPAEISLMPEGLLEKLAEPQIRDLFRYLQSSGAN
jgi:putative heme-binding domain-containing protein